MNSLPLILFGGDNLFKWMENSKGMNDFIKCFIEKQEYKMKSSTRKWLLLDLNHSCFNWTILLIIRVNMFSCCTRRIYRGFTKEKIATFKTKWYFYVLHSFYLLATSIHWEKCDIFILKANISKNELKSVHALADTYIIHFINPDFFSIFKKFFPGLF